MNKKKHPAYQIIGKRSADKSQKKCGHILFRAHSGMAGNIQSELDLNRIHNFTFNQYIGKLIEKKYGEPIKIKDQYKNLVDATILFCDGIDLKTKSEKRGFLSLLMYLLD